MVNRVFTYWQGPTGAAMPPCIDLCNESIRKHCSQDFELHVLGESNIGDLLETGDLPAGFEGIRTAGLRTACIRAALLYKFGGIWFDPDSILFRNPADVMEKVREYGLALCETEASLPLGHFMASEPGNEVLAGHLASLRKAVSSNRGKRLGWLRRLLGPRRGWSSLGIVGEGRKYCAYPADLFAPVSPRDAGRFLSLEDEVADLVKKKTYAVVLHGLAPRTSVRNLTRDELVDGSFLVSRLFRRALGIEETQRHRAYEQVCCHRQVSGSWSGPGSTVAAAAEVMGFLSEIIGRYGIKSIGDLPCGDWTWMKEVDLSGVDYAGYDVVDFLIQENRRKYPGVEFEVLDILNDDIGEFDLIICRDFLIHLPDEDAVRVLEKFRDSGSGFLLTTSFDDLEVNTDLPAGAAYGYRKINLKKPPYSMGEPLEYVREEHRECHGRIVGLWGLR